MGEGVKSHIKTYLMVGGGLLLLTVVTVGASYAPAAVPLAVAIALIIAIAKGSLVASYFMHLIGERKGIYVALGLTLFFFLALMFLPILGHADRIGEHMTVPNANAPVAESPEVH